MNKNTQNNILRGRIKRGVLAVVLGLGARDGVAMMHLLQIHDELQLFQRNLQVSRQNFWTQEKQKGSEDLSGHSIKNTPSNFLEENPEEDTKNCTKGPKRHNAFL